VPKRWYVVLLLLGILVWGNVAHAAEPSPFVRFGEIIEALWPERQISLPPFVKPGLTVLHGATDVRDVLASHAESARRLAFRQFIVHHRLLYVANGYQEAL